jgi:hypothetical protein
MATTAAAIAFIENTNNLLLSGLQSELEGTFLDNATVQVVVNGTNGQPVDGENWPVTMTYIPASQGNYVAGLSHTIAFAPNQKYTAVIDADGSDGHTERFGHWEFPFTAKTRTS